MPTRRPRWRERGANAATVYGILISLPLGSVRWETLFALAEEHGLSKADTETAVGDLRSESAVQVDLVEDPGGEAWILCVMASKVSA